MQFSTVFIAAASIFAAQAAAVPIPESAGPVDGAGTTFSLTAIHSGTSNPIHLQQVTFESDDSMYFTINAGNAHILQLTLQANGSLVDEQNNRAVYSDPITGNVGFASTGPKHAVTTGFYFNNKYLENVDFNFTACPVSGGDVYKVSNKDCEGGLGLGLYTTVLDNWAQFKAGSVVDF